MMYDLDHWRANMILEALHTLDEKWRGIIKDAAAKGDDDTAADYGNDLMRLHLLQEGFERKAIEDFGPSVTNFSREPIEVAPQPTNGETVHRR